MSSTRTKFLIMLTILCFTMVSCEIAERDVLEPGLPEYSEVGKNAAGAIINGLLWRDFNYVGLFSGDSYIRIQYDTIKMKSRITLSAGLVTGIESSEGASIYFDFSNQVLKSREDLKSLHETEWRIDGNTLDAGISSGYFEDLNCEGGRSASGNLFIRGANMYKNEEDISYQVFCGTFGFTIASDCGKINVFRGRFDYRYIVFSPVDL